MLTRGRRPAKAAAQLPQNVRTARLVVVVQGALNALVGVMVVAGSGGIARALGWHSAGGTALVALIGAAILTVSALVLWAAYLLGRISRRARLGILAFELVSVVLGVLSLPDLLQAGLRVVLAVIAIYYLFFDAQAKQLFAAPSAATAPPPTRPPGASARRNG